MERLNLTYKKGILIGLTTVLIIFCLGVFNVSYADVKSKTWDNSDYSMGSWVPVEGKLVVSAYQDNNDEYKVTTVVTMTLSSKNVNRIKLYNSASTSTLVHSDCRGKKTYLTCDVTSKNSSGTSVVADNMHAISVTSNLPNPKYDMENDNGNWDSYREESETVALGTVSAKDYMMTTKWNDKRGKNGPYGGKFLCQYSMSKKGVSDYNTVIIADGVQASVSYCKERGSL